MSNQLEVDYKERFIVQSTKLIVRTKYETRTYSKKGDAPAGYLRHDKIQSSFFSFIHHASKTTGMIFLGARFSRTLRAPTQIWCHIICSIHIFTVSTTWMRVNQYFFKKKSFSIISWKESFGRQKKKARESIIYSDCPSYRSYNNQIR